MATRFINRFEEVVDYTQAVEDTYAATLNGGSIGIIVYNTTIPAIRIWDGVVFQTAPNTTIGTVTTGVWQATPLADAYIASSATWNAKQAALVSGTNIKTVNGSTLLGSGDLVVGGSAAWGSITGTLSSQTDLQTILDLKAPLISPTFVTPALGTPASGVVTNLTGTASININGTIGATTPTTIVGTIITVNTSLLPDADGGAVIGASGNGFSSLFLSEGAVINWDGGDATITQAGNTLTLAGADFFVPDEAYDATGWNGDLSVPTKNAIRDKIETMSGGGISYGRAVTMAYVTL